MADYIADSENQDLATLSGTYTTDEANKVITFGADGQADTAFTLPSGSEWLLIEVFNVESVAGDVGYTKWMGNTYNLSTTLTSARSTALAEYTNFDITATHYKGDNTCDVWRGDQATALALSGSDTGISYTPSGASWKITDTPIAPNPELITDTGFDSASEWSSVAGASVSSSKLVADGTQATVNFWHQTDITIAQGDTFDFSIYLESYTAGNIRFALWHSTEFNFQGGTAYRSSVGTHTDSITADANGPYNRVGVQFVNTADMTCDDISCIKQ